MLVELQGEPTIDAITFANACVRMKGAATSIDLQTVMFTTHLMNKEQRRAFQFMCLVQWWLFFCWRNLINQVFVIRVECLNGNFRAPVAQSAGNKAGWFFFVEVIRSKRLDALMHCLGYCKLPKMHAWKSWRRRMVKRFIFGLNAGVQAALVLQAVQAALVFFYPSNLKPSSG